MSINRRVYLDCEFLPNVGELYGLLSIGLVDDKGNTLYKVNRNAYWNTARNITFHRENTLPHIPLVDSAGGGYFIDRTAPEGATPGQIQIEVAKFFEGYDRHETCVYAWCGAQDLYRLHSLWNHDWVDMPDTIPHWFYDLEAIMQEHDIPKTILPAQDEATRHHALYDAIHDEAVHHAMMEYLVNKDLV